MTRQPLDIRNHEDEALPGLPEPLPPGEVILWQGAPNQRAMALTTFPVLWVAAWFVALAAWRGVSMQGAVDMVAAVTWTLAVGALACGILAFVGWAAAWTTLYTITNRRVVMRVGIAVDKCVNLPFSKIAGAQLRSGADGRGDIALNLVDGARIGWLVFWPHVTPFSLASPIPRLTAVADVNKVAGILRQALVADALRRGAIVSVAPGAAEQSGLLDVPDLAGPSQPAPA